MCRLLAHVSPVPTTFLRVLGGHEVRRFEEMSRLHDDGWGSMWVEEDGHGAARVRRMRMSSPGHRDVRLAELLRNGPPVRTRAIHLRMATASMTVRQVNTHPFLADGVAMAHNGAIVPPTALRRMVAPDLLAHVHGTTDSELYFALIRDGLREGMTPVRALERAIAVIRGEYPVASLNALLLTPEELVVAHASSGSPVPYHDFVASGLGKDLPMNHDEAYFRMSYRQDDDGTFVVASAGLDTEGWADLPQDCIARVDLPTLELRTYELAHVSR